MAAVAGPVLAGVVEAPGLRRGCCPWLARRSGEQAGPRSSLLLQPTSDLDTQEAWSLRCAAGHPVAPTSLRFFQGYVHPRECSLCGTRICREQVRHRCEACDYDVCVGCFEGHHLRCLRRSTSSSSSNSGASHAAAALAAAVTQPRAFPPLPLPGRNPKLLLPGGDSAGEEEDDEEILDLSAVTRAHAASAPALPCSSPSSAQPSTAEADPAASPDGLAGRGVFAIPEAVPDVAGLADRLAQAADAGDLDLRRFLRAGDILNFLGGNPWGHTVLVLAVPRAFEVPVLTDVDPSVQVLGKKVPAYFVKVLQSASNMLEISISTCCLVVHPLTRRICAAKEVHGGLRLSAGRDGQPIRVEALLSPLSNATLDFDVFRLCVEEVQRAPQDSKWSFKTAVRSYLKNAALQAEKFQDRDRKRQLARHLNERWRRRPVCSTIPPRVWQKYLLKRCQTSRSALPTYNGVGAAVARGAGPGALSLYCGRPLSPAEADAAAGQGDRDRLRCCGAVGCTASPDARCGPLEGQQCRACLRAQWALPSDDADPEVAWAEDVLRLMPVKDDRVLPDELFQLLQATGLWSRLDLARGPPPHRRADGAAPPKAEAFNSRWQAAFERVALPNGLRNAEGALVMLGADRFTVYCGRQVAKPQQLTPRFGLQTGGGKVFHWDGRCGPGEGPQCSACRRLEDRLLA